MENIKSLDEIDLNSKTSFLFMMQSVTIVQQFSKDKQKFMECCSDMWDTCSAKTTEELYQTLSVLSDNIRIQEQMGKSNG